MHSQLLTISIQAYFAERGNELGQLLTNLRAKGVFSLAERSSRELVLMQLSQWMSCSSAQKCDLQTADLSSLQY